MAHPILTTGEAILRPCLAECFYGLLGDLRLAGHAEGADAYRFCDSLQPCPRLHLTMGYVDSEWRYAGQSGDRVGHFLS